MKKNIIKIINVILIFIFIISICTREMQNDTFWSICVGQELVEEGIKKVDEWSIHSNLKYVAHHFLTDVLIYFIHNIAGFVGLYGVEIGLTCIIAMLFYISNKNITNNSRLSYMFTYVELLLFRPFVSVRAQMISTIIFLIQFIMLEKITKEYKKRYAAILALLPLLLANFHMGVILFYFVIIGVYIVASLGIGKKTIVSEKNTKLFKTLLIISLVGLVLIFVNPYGIDGAIYGVKTLLSDSITYNIAEFQSLTISSEIGIIIFLYVLVSIAIIYKSKKLYLKDLLLYLGTFFMACVSLRYVLYFAIFSSVILHYIKKIKLNLSSTDVLAANTTIYVVIVAVTFLLFGQRIGDKQYVNENKYPVKAYESIQNFFGENTRVFNEYSWGSYLMLNNQKVYIDSRLDLYTEEYNKGVTVFKDYLDIDTKYNEIIEKYDINMFFVKANTPLSTILSVDNDFNLVYEDDVAVVYVKNI